MNCYWILPLIVVYGGLFSSIKIRDRKLNRKKEQNRHLEMLEELETKHKERLAILGNMKKAELDAALEEVEKEIAELQSSALDGKELED